MHTKDKVVITFYVDKGNTTDEILNTLDVLRLDWQEGRVDDGSIVGNISISTEREARYVPLTAAIPYRSKLNELKSNYEKVNAMLNRAMHSKVSKLLFDSQKAEDDYEVIPS
jgi:hypothetical protein